MGYDQEERIKKEIQEQLSTVCFSEERADRILRDVHQQIIEEDMTMSAPVRGKGQSMCVMSMRERRKRMRYNKKRTGLVVAAALVVMGAVTAVAAGKVAYTSSSTHLDERIDTVAEFLPQAKATLGEGAKILQRYSHVSAFAYGYLIDVEAFDDANNKVGSYPEANVSYTGPGNVNLSVTKPLKWAAENDHYQVEESYKDIRIQGKTDRYLFLPPDQEPSEEERKQEAEGKLMISYGSSEVERKEFHSVSWREGDLQYLLYTFEDVQLGDLVAMAKETIDHAE